MAKREFQIQSVRVVIGLLRNFQESKKFPFLNCATPFENPQRWMGQNTFPILLLNDDNMIGEHQKTRMKMLYGCPFEKNEKEVFFRLTTFFSGTKKFCSRNNFCSVFYVLLKTFWKIESPNAISGIHLGGMAKKIFFLVTKLFCFSRQNAETFRFSLKLDFVKPHKISNHLAFSDNCYFHLFYRLSD